MTKQELIKILDEKIENAKRDFYIKQKEISDLFDKKQFDDLDEVEREQCILSGEIDAYKDVLNLIESSGELNDK